MMQYTPRGTATKWLEAAIAYDGDECMPWPFSRTVDGHGHFKKKGKSFGVAREICRITHGKPPEDYYVAAHSCGNAPCCNKRHIRWATQAENKADELLHGTRYRGEQVTCSKLSEDQVRSIRLSASRPVALAAQFNVTPNTVYSILRRETWAWLA